MTRSPEWLDYLYPALNHALIFMNQKHPGIRGLRVVLVGKNDVVELIISGELNIATRRVGFRSGVRVVVGIILAIVFIDIVEDTPQIFWSNDREIVRVFSSISGRVVLHYLTVLTRQQAARLIGIASYHV